MQTIKSVLLIIFSRIKAKPEAPASEGDTDQVPAVIFLDWVNSGAPWWSRSLTGLDPVDLIGWME